MSDALTVLPSTSSTTLLVPVHHGHRPRMSSPLASSPTSSPCRASPLNDLQKRRRSQFKSRAASDGTRGAAKHSSSQRVAPIPFALTPGRTNPYRSETTSQASFLRERFKAKCFERARQSRRKNIERRRSLPSDFSSDGADLDVEMDAEMDDDDDALFNDELFQRIVANEKRRRLHAYALSYELDVGSSFDPDMEDVTEWETQLQSNVHDGSQSAIPQEDTPPPDVLDDLEFGDDLFDEIDEYGDDSAWVDEYIATIPDEVLIDAKIHQLNSSKMPDNDLI